MKRSLFLLSGALMLIFAPILACGPSAASRVTPTPTKTPKRVLALEQTPTSVATPTPAPTSTPVPTDTPTLPPPPTDTPLPPTDTPTPVPTDTPVPPPPPPPTFTPAPPPPPTQPPAPQPTQPPPSALQVIIELPDGKEFSAGDKVKINFIVTDPNGVSKFEWGIFTQNQTPLKNGKKDCGGATECREEIKENAPSLSGTYIIGADAVSSNGATKRGIGEIYVSD
ncbi:MAG: hypothetical protein U0401_08455 [Anaerolineae bacterium]